MVLILCSGCSPEVCIEEEDEDLVERCEKLSQALAQIESVERSSNVFDFPHVVDNKCIIVISAAFQGESNTYSESGARERIRKLMVKHGAL